MVSPTLYPFQGHYLDLRGLRYHYLDEGQGETLVMVHGNPTWSFYYREAVKGLRDAYRTIVPDHMGCGLSDKPDDSRYTYTLRQRVDDLETLIEHLDLPPKLTLMVHDWGGMIGMGYAIRHPQRIGRLVILNTAAFHLPFEKPFPWILRLVRDFPLSPYVVRRFNAFSRGAAWVACTRRRLSPELRAAYCEPYESWENSLATLRFVQDIPLNPGDPAYDLVSESEAALRAGIFGQIPTLICWGGRDFIFDHHFLNVWQRYLPQAEVKVFPDCGHYVLEDAAAEIVPLVRRFLQDHPLP